MVLAGDKDGFGNRVSPLLHEKQRRESGFDVFESDTVRLLAMLPPDARRAHVVPPVLRFAGPVAIHPPPARSAVKDIPEHVHGTCRRLGLVLIRLEGLQLSKDLYRNTRLRKLDRVAALVGDETAFRLLLANKREA